MSDTIYLYKKTHNTTGLKYLGKTVQNPFKYKGSGKEWSSHCKEHGYNITTEILFETTDKKELQQKGRYYSELWDVVNSPEWANVIPETGGGPGCKSGENHHYSKLNPNYDSSKHCRYGKTLSESTLDKLRQASSGKNNPNYGSKWINDGLKNKKIKNNDVTPIGWQEGRITSFGKYEKIGKKNSNYDSTPRHFINDDGRQEYCTQRELIDKYCLRESSVSSIISGRIKSTAGWRVK